MNRLYLIDFRDRATVSDNKSLTFIGVGLTSGIFASLYSSSWITSAVRALNLIGGINVNMKIDYRRISAAERQRRSLSTMYNWGLGLYNVHKNNKIVLYIGTNKMTANCVQS